MKIPDLGRGYKKTISAALGVMAICLLLGVETGGWFERLKGMVEGKAQSGTEALVVTGTAENLPAGLDRTEWKSIVAAHETAKYEMTRTNDGWQGWNPGQQWVTKFDGRGFLTQPANRAWQWGVELTGYGFGDHQQAVNGEQVVRNGDKNRIAFRRDHRQEEWYINDQRGLEHGFILNERPEGAVKGAPLTFSLRTRGSLKGEMNANARSIAFRKADGGTVINYSGLRVWDAHGVDLPARFTPLANGEFQILVEEEAAVYPVTVDPIAQQAYLKASNAQALDAFGRSVAISGDTVVVGAISEGSSATGGQSDNSKGSVNQGGEMGEKRQRKSYTNQLKARVALEAIKGQRTINEIASDYELHPNLVN